MFTQKFRLAGFITLSLLGFSSAAAANDMDDKIHTEQTVHIQNFDYMSSPQSVSTHQTATRGFDLYQKDYMRETYQDVQIKLFGPVKLGVTENIIQHRFSNIDLNIGQRIRNSNFADHFDDSTYSRATAATTSVKFKF